MPPQRPAVPRAPAPPAQALERLSEVAAALPPTDGMGACCRVLLAAARAEGGASGGGGGETAREPRPPRGATVLAERLLASMAAAEAGEPVSACWRPLLRLRYHPRVTWAQFAFAGLNAHYGHDVPLLLAHGGTERATAPPLPGQPDLLEEEFHRMVGLLARAEEGAREVLFEEAEPLSVTEPLAHLAGVWSAERAQRDAWTSCQLLRALSQTPSAAAQFAGQLDARTGLTGWLLLTPLERRHRGRR